MSFQAFLEQFLEARGLSAADGRPLYAYRCTSDEFARLTTVLAEALGASGYPNPSPQCAQAFCLWAAEWWRRNHEGGWWAWEPMLKQIGCSDYCPGGPYYKRLHRMVEEGLRRWGRELLKFQFSSLFLVTLACEGGLPVKVIRKDTASLRNYFQALLEEIRLFGPSGASPRELAERVNFRLPRSLRHDVVYKLSGDLIAEIWKLQPLVAGQDNPVAFLDKEYPRWRDGLPFSVDDGVARALLNNLLLDATKIARGGGGRFRFVRVLRREGARIELVNRLQLPGTLTDAHLRSLLHENAHDFPVRCEVCVQDIDLVQTVAFLTARPGTENNRQFTIEPINGGTCECTGSAAADDRQLVFRADSTIPVDRLHGANRLSELPWTFEDTGDPAEEQRFVGEGSTTVRTPAAIIACTSGTEFELLDHASSEEVGSLESLDRKLVRVRGAVRMRDELGNIALVRTGQESASDEEYRLFGRRIEIGRAREPVFAGTPEIVVLNGEGPGFRLGSSEPVQWRGEGAGPQWMPFGSHIRGSGTMRCLDADGMTRLLQRIQIVPAQLRINYQPASSDAGAIELSGLENAEVAVLPSDADIQWSTDRAGSETFRVHVRAHGKVPVNLEVLLRWHTGSCRLQLPFPAQGARFEFAGVPLGPDASVSIDRLSRVRALAVVPKAGADFHVEGRYYGDDVALVEPQAMLMRFPMQETVPGLSELSLAQNARTIESRLAFSSDDSGNIGVRIQSNLADVPQRVLRIHRFDFELVGDWDASLVCLPGGLLSRSSAEEIGALRVQAIPLLASYDAPIVLDRASNAAWHFPNDLAPGPWLITAWEGNWCRSRPLWRFVKRQELTEGSHPLVRYFSSHGTDEESRERAAQQMIEAMRNNAQDPGWDLFDAHLKMTEELPPTSFGLIRAVAHDPLAATIAAFRAPGDSAFSQLFRALEKLPFWWKGITADGWQSGARVFVESIRQDLSAIDQKVAARLVVEAFEKAAGRITRELPALMPVIDVAGAKLFCRTASEANHLTREGVRRVLLAARAEANSKTQYLPSEVWRLRLECVTDVIRRLDSAWIDQVLISVAGNESDQVYEVRNAPVVAAVCSVLGLKLSLSQTYALRSAAEMAPEWFDEVYRTSYLCAFGLKRSSEIDNNLSDCQP